MNTTTTHRRSILDAAAKIAAVLFYVDPPNCLDTMYCVRSTRNGARMSWSPTAAGATRRALRLGISRLRLAKELPGLAKENQAILDDTYQH